MQDVLGLRLELVGRAAERVGRLASNTGGMICCAVGICAITERKREKNSVQTSNSKLLNRAMIFSAIISALSKRSVRTARKSTISTIWLA